MEKYLLGLVFVCIGLYLFVSFTGFYSFLGIKNLRPPAHPEVITIGTGEIVTRIAALGDSLTDGVGVADYKESFGYLLAEELSAGETVELTNTARAGDTSGDLIDRQLPKIEGQKFDIVTVLIGVNDIHQRVSGKTFEKNYRLIVNAAKNTGAKVYCVSLPYIGSEQIVRYPFNRILDNRTKQFNDIIKQIASDTDCVYIDIYKLDKSADFYSEDLFHPSKDGYKEWLEAF